MQKNPEEERRAVEGDGRLPCEAELCHGPGINASAGLEEGLEESRNLGRGKMVKPLFIPSFFELAFFNRDVEDKIHNAVNQCGNDAHLGDSGSASEGANRRFAKDGIIFLEGTVGSFGCRT